MLACPNEAVSDVFVCYPDGWAVVKKQSMLINLISYEPVDISLRINFYNWSQYLVCLSVSNLFMWNLIFLKVLLHF